MAKHKPSIVWPTHRIGTGTAPPWAVVSTASAGELAISVLQQNGSASFTISRKLARLLAKRINQCLDETV